MYSHLRCQSILRTKCKPSPNQTEYFWRVHNIFIFQLTSIAKPLQPKMSTMWHGLGKSPHAWGLAWNTIIPGRTLYQLLEWQLSQPGSPCSEVELAPTITVLKRLWNWVPSIMVFCLCNEQCIMKLNCSPLMSGWDIAQSQVLGTYWTLSSTDTSDK